MAATRRELLIGSGLALSAVPAMAAAKRSSSTMATDLDRYVTFGDKVSGGPGDTACGAWLQGELERAGYSVERQPFDAPFFEVARAELTIAGTAVTIIPQAIVVPTPPNGITARLVRVDPVTGPIAPLDGAIALIDLPFQRWSSMLAKPIAGPVQAVAAAGALAVVIITNGPTGEALALNAPGERPTVPIPVAILAPKQAKPFLLAAGADRPATLIVTGTGGRRPAFNLIGRIDRGRKRWLAVSTPRSGWFTCAGERGGGVAVWLDLARWAADAAKDHDLAFLCNSGHEYEYLGAERALAALAPSPGDTALWLHLGANVAARDWHEPGGGVLLPLPSADSLRFLTATPTLIATARDAFIGQPGLEAVYPAGSGAAGELANILAAGYPTVAGIFGAHRFHHAAADDVRCIVVPPVEQVADSLRRVIASVRS